MKHTFRSLGLIDLEAKKEIWKNKVSGSQVSRILNDPDILYEEKKGLRTPYDPSSNEIVKLKMAMGNRMESTILQLAKEQYALDIKEDKDTFQSDTYDLRTANIDGYIGEDINNIDYIVEIKNTGVDNINTLVDRYLPQLNYYVSFFGAKKGGIFLFFINGWNLVKVTVERDEIKIEALDKKVNDFEQALIMDEIPEIPKDPELIEVVLDTNKTEEQNKNLLINRFKEVKESIKQYKAEEIELKNEIDSWEHGKAKIYGTEFYINKLRTVRKGSVDYKALSYALIEKAGLEILDMENQYRGESTASYQIRINKNKEVKND